MLVNVIKTKGKRKSNLGPKCYIPACIRVLFLPTGHQPRRRAIIWISSDEAGKYIKCRNMY